MSILAQPALTPDRPAAPPSRRAPLVPKLLALFAVTAAAWHFAAAWVPAASERFYVLAAPLLLLWMATLATGGWRDLRPYVRRAVVFVLVLSVIGVTAFLFVIPRFMGPTLAGLIDWPGAGEVALTIYFAATVTLLICTTLAAARWLGRRVDERLLGPCPEQPSRGRTFLRHDLPLLLLVPLLAPYLLAVFYVHRCKVPNIAAPQEVLGRPCEDVEFTTDDGMTLHGWFLPAKAGPSSRTVLLCHGLGVNRSGVVMWHPIGDALDANIFLFDFRGHGDSDGHTLSYGCREKLDVLAAVRYLRTQRREQAREIIGMGTSMGAASLALGAAEVEPPLDAIILDSSYASAVDLSENILRLLPSPVAWALEGPGIPLASLHAGCDLREARPLDTIASVRCPVLLIHSEGDPLIPAQHSRRLFERAVEPKQLWITDTKGHCSSWKEYDEYVRRCRVLLEKR